jgi:hypothetical protein
VGELGLAAGGIGIKLSTLGFTASAASGGGGSGYAVGDTITLTGGTILRPVILTVTSLTGSAVASASITDPGLYTSAPSNPVAQGSTSGSGTGAAFSMTFVAASTLSDAAGVALWSLMGASSYMATAMQQPDGQALADYIGASALAAAIQSSLPVLTPQGRLTLQSQTPVMSSDAVSQSLVYYTPYNGNLVPVWNGTLYINQPFSELSLTLTSNHLAATAYDVFAFMDGSTLRIGTGPSWANSGAGTSSRGSGPATTALARLNGILVNAASITVRNGASTYSVDATKGTYLGSLLIDSSGAGTVTANFSYGQARKFGVWNYYNRVPISLLAGNPGDWPYNTPSFSPANATLNNSVQTFQGVAEDTIIITYSQAAAAAAGMLLTQIGIGWNNTTSPSGFLGRFVQPSGSGGVNNNMYAQFTAQPSLGLNAAYMLIYGNATVMWSGNQNFCLMQASYNT